MKTVEIDALFARYPNPVADRSAPGDAYCVGAIACRGVASKSTASFPDARVVASAIQKLNPRIAEEPARWGAQAITTWNDIGWIAVALGILREALHFGEDE